MSESMIDEQSAGVETLDDADIIPDDGATVAPDADVVDQADDDLDGTGDTFPRKVVEKLRKESADHRGRAKAAEDRAQAAENRVAAMQRQTAEARITAAGMRPSAVWAVSKLDDVLAEDGSVDMAAVDRAMKTARSTLGIPQKGRARLGLDGLHSGATAPGSHRGGPSFVDSFRPRKHD
ncbi:MAG: hypothetical protein WBB07_15545 [Mycobacterium sp.]